MVWIAEPVSTWLQLSMTTSVRVALSRRGWLRTVDAVLVEFTGSTRDVPDCRALAEASGGAAIFWLLDNDDVVDIGCAVDARVSGAFYRDQVAPAHAFLDHIEGVSRGRVASTAWGIAALAGLVPSTPFRRNFEAVAHRRATNPSVLP